MKHCYTRLSAILSMMLIAMFMFIPSEMKAQNYAEYEKLLREYLMENDLKTNFELEAYTAIAKDKINSLKEFSKMLEQDKDKYAKDLAKRYSEEQYYDDIIAIFAQILRVLAYQAQVAWIFLVFLHEIYVFIEKCLVAVHHFLE